jgi:hypothetical protein
MQKAPESQGGSLCPAAETAILFSSLVYEILKALPTFSFLRAQNGSLDDFPPVLLTTEQVFTGAPRRLLHVTQKEMCVMTLRRIQISAISVVLFILFLAPGVAQPTPPPANWTFEGCWTQFSAGPCRDVYRDQQGNAWICRGCGTTGNPGLGKCNPITQATLNSGFWCS